ncbi:hypothetical protein CDD82_1363 [Ophiocordyceps australis]|uniref:PABS domain-containing protein n=1 Tax=Ophiocordyceps australis TaxID=1399860 RepID=A0A2C5ZJ45_9HYPO|nr:hypothetical protein CDD82_1363 [Ophiocordyceps australis]
MAPPKQTKSSHASPEAFTPQRFERELKHLAAKARSDTWSRRAARQLTWSAKVVVLLVLLGVTCNASQLNLSPVYGSIPAAIWHSRLVMTACFLGWAGNLMLRHRLNDCTPQLLPLVAAFTPVVQWLLARYSGQLGAQLGPLLTETLTLFPLAILTAASVADLLENTRLPLLPSFVADAAPGLASWALFKYSEHLMARHLQANMGRAIVYTRLGLEMTLSAVYAALAPSKLLLYALPALLHTLLLNTHVSSPAATSTLVSSLLSHNWLLLDRRDSLTGYVSVLQSVEHGYRVMRCDHSLLGGEWIQARGGDVSEPIYGVFAMLEAVRLVERVEAVADKDSCALVIGLGVGTTPSALVAHGVNTTIVEIDPVVYEFAVKYFDLRENNAPVLDDAVSYTAALAATAPATYDYIVHDVFTGGAEPAHLFTLEFLEGLATLLKPNGVIAINYAGDLALPPPGIILRTIKQVFTTCRVFREMPPDAKAIQEKGTDFTNMVIFCSKDAEAPLRFRKPETGDLLNSHARKQFLHLQNEVSQAEVLAGSDEGILRRNDTTSVEKWHQQSALGHWAIMRTAVPALVWEQW